MYRWMLIENFLGDGIAMTIEKLSDYMAFVEELPRGFTLSRGQSNNYPLLPSALRRDKRGIRKYSKRCIRNFLSQFKIQSHQFMESPWDVTNDVEWMLHAQHYGIPTKLMDFTTSHLISLLFALEKAFLPDQEHDSVVYFLNPIELNNQVIQQSQILNISDSTLKSDCYDGPFVVQGRRINPRVDAQKGLFVYFQDDDEALDETFGEDIIRKLVIKGIEKKNILASLYSMGISFTSIYPELSSVARDILLQQDILELLREKE